MKTTNRQISRFAYDLRKCWDSYPQNMRKLMFEPLVQQLALKYGLDPVNCPYVSEFIRMTCNQRFSFHIPCTMTETDARKRYLETFDGDFTLDQSLEAIRLIYTKGIGSDFGNDPEEVEALMVLLAERLEIIKELQKAHKLINQGFQSLKDGGWNTGLINAMVFPPPEVDICDLRVTGG